MKSSGPQLGVATAVGMTRRSRQTQCGFLAPGYHALIWKMLSGELRRGIIIEFRGVSNT